MRICTPLGCIDATLVGLPPDGSVLLLCHGFSSGGNTGSGLILMPETTLSRKFNLFDFNLVIAPVVAPTTAIAYLEEDIRKGFLYVNIRGYFKLCHAFATPESTLRSIATNMKIRLINFPEMKSPYLETSVTYEPYNDDMRELHYNMLRSLLSSKLQGHAIVDGYNRTFIVDSVAEKPRSDYLAAVAKSKKTGLARTSTLSEPEQVEQMLLDSRLRNARAGRVLSYNSGIVASMLDFGYLW